MTDNPALTLFLTIIFCSALLTLHVLKDQSISENPDAEKGVMLIFLLSCVFISFPILAIEALIEMFEIKTYGETRFWYYIPIPFISIPILKKLWISMDNAIDKNKRS